MGGLAARLRRPGARAHPRRLLEIRRPHPAEEQVRADLADERPRVGGGVDVTE